MEKKEKLINTNTEGLYVVEKMNFDFIIVWQDSSGVIYETRYKSEPEVIYSSLAEYIISCDPDLPKED